MSNKASVLNKQQEKGAKVFCFLSRRHPSSHLMHMDGYLQEMFFKPQFRRHCQQSTDNGVLSHKYTLGAWVCPEQNGQDGDSSANQVGTTENEYF